MSDPLERRLRDSLSRHADDVAPSADGWTTIRERAARADHALAGRRRAFRLVASGALAALAAVAVPLTLDRLRSGDDDIAFAPPPPITSETATPAASPSPSASAPSVSASASPAPSALPSPTLDPTPPAPAVAQGWTVVDDGGALTPSSYYVSLEDAAALGSRVAAVGSFHPTSDATQAAVWLADGGTDWRMVDDAELFGGQPDTYTEALGVTATGRGFVAVGSGSGGYEVEIPLVWTSPDGTAWERTELPGEGRALAVTEVAGGGLVATGHLGDGNNAPAIWTSADGVTWDLTVLDLLGMEGWLEHVVAVGDRVVALGLTSVAISEDGGGSWSQVAREDAGLLKGAVEDLVVLGDGSLAGVVATDSGLVAHTSADGTTWEPTAPFPPSPQEGTQRVEQIVALDDGTLVAAGLAFDETDTRTVAAVWTSEDGGVRWVRDEEATVAMGQEASVTALAVTDNTLVALGNGPGGAEAGGRAWTRPLP